jgi:hypothetical protein
LLQVLCEALPNAATEEQAVNRVHRLGQTRPMQVRRFATRDTAEHRLLLVHRARINSAAANTKANGNNTVAANNTASAGSSASSQSGGGGGGGGSALFSPQPLAYQSSFALDENGLGALGAATTKGSAAVARGATQQLVDSATGKLGDGSQTAVAGLTPEELAFVVGASLTEKGE